jgi:superfamily I DNA/RNA helicase/mRNA-degrading endonuclease RelE of RelBE toxin-antitoxin system
MPYQEVWRQSFKQDFVQLIKSEQLKVLRAIERIVTEPHGAQVKKILKDTYTNLYRYRVGALRICYALGTKTIALLAVGPRDEIYERLRRRRPDSTVQEAIVEDAALVQAPRAFKTLPGDAAPEHLPEGSDAGLTEPTPEVNAPEKRLLDELLVIRGVDEAQRSKILACESAEQLFDLDLPEEVLGLLFHISAPPTLQEIEDQPSYLAPALAEFERDPDACLSSLLLALDNEQSRAANSATRGPLLVRGGPGTGKSIVSLYRVRHLYEPQAQQELFGSRVPRTLVVTYTKALTRLSEQLLKRLLGPDLLTNVLVETLDTTAWRVAGPFAKDTARGTTNSQQAVESARRSLLAALAEHVPGRKALEALPAEFLLKEFDWVIDGRNLESLDEYLSCNRSGRGTRLDVSQRRLVWQLYNTWRESLVESSVATFTQVQCEALRRAAELPESEKYDVVVLDEAQDLKPVGIRLALALCRTPQGFYMTADENQSIYGRGYSWRQVSDDLRVQGRSIVLRRNYRTTRQIQEAALAFLRSGGIEDPESQAVPVHDGPRPVVAQCNGAESEAIARLFGTWSKELALPTYMGAVLTRTHREAETVANELNALGIESRACKSGDIDVDERRVKCMTIHTAKGLEFPFVALAGLTMETIPRRSYEAADADDLEEHVKQERRLLHVGMTRAMKRLLVCVPPIDPSPFLKDLHAEHWDIQQF